jgi:plastocyanin
VTLADPEQIFQEVLQEEQQKGSAGPVAEGRAKAARVRAEHGSPHPKEPRWWPGAQPHLEGGDGQAPTAEAEPAAEPAPAPEAPAQPPEEEAPAAEAPAEAAPAQAPAAEAPAAEAPAQAPAAEAPAQAPAAQAPAAAQQAPPATPTETPPAQRPPGVRHGTTTGTRLRPEDVVATEAQFEGERAMQERRKLIDDLVASGVPAVTAAGTGRPRAPYLAVLYLIIPLVVVAFLVGQQTSAPPAEASGEGATEAPADSGGGADGGEEPVSGTDVTLVAESLAFNTEEIGFPPAEQVSLTLDNQDTAPHDLAIYPDEEAATARENDLFSGEQVPAGSETTFEFRSPDAGDYYFLCTIHPTMNGSVVVQ